MSPLYVGSPCYPLNASHLEKLFDQNLRRSWNAVPFEVYCIIIGLVGATGNLLVICIYRRRKNKSSSTYFIMTLAAIDLCVCLTVIPFSILHEAFLKYSWSEETACKIFEWFKHSSLSISCLMLTFIAIDRYIAICHPLSVLVSHVRAKFMVIISFVLGAGFQTQTLVFFGVRTTRVDDELLGCRCDVKDEYYRTARHVYFIASLLTGYAILLIIIVVCYVLVWLTVRKRHIDKQKQQLGSFISNNTANSESSDGDQDRCCCCCSRRKIVPGIVHETPKWATQRASPGSSSQEDPAEGVGIGNGRNKSLEAPNPTENKTEKRFGNDKALNRSGVSLGTVVWDDIVEDDDNAPQNDVDHGPDADLPIKRALTDRSTLDLIKHGGPSSSHEDKKSSRVSLVVPNFQGIPNQVYHSGRENSHKEGKCLRNKRVSFESDSSGKNSLGQLSNDFSSGSDEQADDGRKCMRRLLNRMESVQSVDFRNHFLPRVQEIEAASGEIQTKTAADIEEDIKTTLCSMICCSKSRNSRSSESNQDPQSLEEGEKSFCLKLCCMSNSQAKTLHMSDSMQAALNSYQQARYKTARLLLIVTVVFLLTWLPFWMVMIASYVDENLWFKAKPAKLNLLLIGRHFYFINSMTNPIIYAFLNRRFRDELKKLGGPLFQRLKKFCCCKKQPG